MHDFVQIACDSLISCLVLYVYIYSTEEEERTERLKYKKKARNKRKKFQALPSLAVDNDEENEDKEQM